MPENYKSQLTIIGSTAATTIYDGVTVTGGYALVNSINISNTNTSYGNLATVEIVRGSTGYSIITAASIPVQASLQVLDSPLVVQEDDILRLTAGYTYGIDVIVSALEIT